MMYSIILPTHNRPELLKEAVGSVGAQRFDDWELIVVDDASTEPLERDELDRLAGRPITLLRHEQSLGGAAAKSAGVRAARGTYLAFLDDDDLLEPDYLEEAHKVLQSHSDLSALFMGVRWFGEKAVDGQRAQDDNLKRIKEASAPQCDQGGLCLFESEALLRALLERIPMPFQRPVVSRERFYKIGEYRPECLLWDCDWALRAVVHGPCALLERGLYLQRADRQGYSSRIERALEQSRSAIEMKEYLLTRPLLGSRYGRNLKAALSRDWFSHAWQLQQAERWSEADQALGQAVKYGVTPAIVKLYLAGLAKRLLHRRT